MKKLLLPLFIFLTVFNANAQDLNILAKSKLNKISFPKLDISSYENGNYKFCGKDLFIDDNGEMKIDEKFTFNILIEDEKTVIKSEGVSYDYDTDGDSLLFKTVIFSTHKMDNYYDFNSSIAADSTMYAVKDSLGNWGIAFSSRAFYDGDLLKKIITYVDFGLIFNGDPIGLFKYSEQYFHYKNNKLSYTTTIALSFATNDYEKADSVHYSYQNGNVVEEVSYLFNLDSLKYFPYKKFTYEYDNNNNVSLEVEYSFQVDKWVPETKTYYNYDEKNRMILSLSEERSLVGDTWEPDSKDSIVYDQPTLYLDFYNKNITQFYEDGKWNTEYIETFEDCGSVIEKTAELTPLDFNAYFDGDNIILDASDNLTSTKMTIRLVDLQGRAIFNKGYKELPHYIKTNDLPGGIYMINIITKDKYGTVKVVKQ